MNAFADAFKNAKQLKDKPVSSKTTKKQVSRVQPTQDDQKSDQFQKKPFKKNFSKRNQKKQYPIVKIESKDLVLAQNAYSEKSKEIEQAFINEHGYETSRRDIYFERRTLEGLRIALKKQKTNPDALKFKVEDGTVELVYQYNKETEKEAHLKWDRKFSFELWAYRRIELIQTLIDMTKERGGDIRSYVSVLRTLQSFVTEVTGEVFERPQKKKTSFKKNKRPNKSATDLTPPNKK